MPSTRQFWESATKDPSHENLAIVSQFLAKNDQGLCFIQRRYHKPRDLSKKRNIQWTSESELDIILLISHCIYKSGFSSYYAIVYLGRLSLTVIDPILSLKGNSMFWKLVLKVNFNYLKLLKRMANQEENNYSNQASPQIWENMPHLLYTQTILKIE